LQDESTSLPKVSPVTKSRHARYVYALLLSDAFARCYTAIKLSISFLINVLFLIMFYPGDPVHQLIYSKTVIQSEGELVFQELVIFGSRILSRYTIDKQLA